MRRGDGVGDPGAVREWLLARMVPSDYRDSVIGDARQEFRRITESDGLHAARRWYSGQIVSSLVPAARHGAGALAGQVIGSFRGMGGKGMWTKELRVAIRVLLKQPGFTAGVCLMVALGVGATTALFGVFRTVFLQPLPIPDSEEIVFLMQSGGFGCCGPSSGPDYLDGVERQRSFEGMAILSPRTANLASDGTVERVFGTLVSANAFDLVGISPQLGRALEPEDANGAQVVVLNHGFWQRDFGGDPDVIGTSLRINDEPWTVVGVMPEGFDIPSPWNLGRDHQFYQPFPVESLQENRGSRSYPVFARLSPGTDVDAAQADMDRVMRELAQEYPETNAERGIRVFDAHEYLYGNFGEQFGLILGAAIVVLLVACGNIAALQLARAAGRGSELSVRAAIGAPRGAIIRLLFTESAVLALTGGVLGILVALAGMRAFGLIIPPNVPRTDGLALDGLALVVALGASAGAALAFGMLPAIVSSRANLAMGVREGGQGTDAPAKERLRDAFIVGQIALGLVLANGAALLVRSYTTLTGQEYGFEADGVLTVGLAAAGSRYEDATAREAYYQQVVDRVASVPGVAAAGMITRLPLYGGSNGNVWIEGTPPRASQGEGPLVEVTSVVGNYFETMGVPIQRGRALEAPDSTTGNIGVVINETLAEQAWPDENPIGKRFTFQDNPPVWWTVVGVAGDVRQWSPERPPVGQAYVPYTQGWAGSGFITVKSSSDPATLVPQVRQAIREVDPNQPPTDIRSMTERVDNHLSQRRFYTTVIGLFAVAALFLAAAGIYGTVSYYVARKNRDLGIRMALGANGTGIVGLVVGRGVRLALVGVGIGLVGAWLSGRFLESLVYGVGTSDLGILAVGCMVLAITAVLASAVPALRAIRVPPVLALKSE